MPVFLLNKLPHVIFWWLLTASLMCLLTFLLVALLYGLSRLESLAGQKGGLISRLMRVRLVSLLSLVGMTGTTALAMTGGVEIGARLLLDHWDSRAELLGELGAAVALLAGMPLLRVLLRDFKVVEFNFSKFLYRFVETLVVGFHLERLASWCFSFLPFQTKDSFRAVKPLVIVFVYWIMFAFPLILGVATVSHLKAHPAFAQPEAQLVLAMVGLVVLVLYSAAYWSVGALLGPETLPFQAMRKKRNKMTFWLLVMTLGIGVSLGVFMLSLASGPLQLPQLSLAFIGIVLSVVSTLDPLCNAYTDLREALDASGPGEVLFDGIRLIAEEN